MDDEDERRPPRDERVVHWFEDEQASIPADLTNTLEASGLPAPGRHRAARELWEDALRAAEERGDESDCERLLWLTAALYDPSLELDAHHTEAWSELRNASERALKALPSERHRQLLSALRCRAACREGQLTEAEAWLAGCDPTSDDSECRASRRLAAAWLESRRGSFSGVVAELGGSRRELPDSRRFAAESALVAADALERTGQLEQATALVLGAPLTFGNDCARAMARLHAAYARAGIELCPRAIRVAQLRYARVVISRGFHWYDSWYAPLVIGAFVTLLGMVLLLTESDSGPGAFFGGLACIVASLWMRRVARREAELLAFGLPSVARLQSLTPTGRKVNHSFQFELSLRVFVKSQWVAVKVKKLVHPLHLSRFTPGAALPVRVDEATPQRLSFELD